MASKVVMLTKSIGPLRLIQPGKTYFTRYYLVTFYINTAKVKITWTIDETE